MSNLPSKRKQDNIQERAILVGVQRPNQEWSVESSLEELARLVDTAGGIVVAQTSQRLDTLNPRTFIGSGKAEEVAGLVRAYAAELVVFDDELSPSQQSNLEKIMGEDVKVIDRTALILDIFALHASSREGRLQVRLAQNIYLLPRLRGMWAHLASNRMGGGVGSRFGEGESQLEVDRRMVRKRITSIRREIADITQNRELQRKKRYDSGVFKVALAGYTNAGKSSLLNAISDSEVVSIDKLFATLDSTTRKIKLAGGREVTFTDTVGFIQKLPTTLVDAFRSTLDEINGADFILHVIDAADEHLEMQMETVRVTLEQIGADEIGRIEVFNKIDLLSEEERTSLKIRFPEALFISTKEDLGIDELLQRISLVSSAQDSLLNVLIPYSEGQLVSLAHQRCTILSEHYEETGTKISLRVSPDLVSRFEPFAI